MNSSSPFIGIPCYHDVSSGFGKKPVNAQFDAYLSAVSRAGGVPFLIPLSLEMSALRELFNLASGIVLTGGGDIDPAYYHQVPQTKLYNVQPDRDQVEMAFSRWASEEGKPALGICRGVQVMAVAAGGTLCQDLPLQKPEAELHNYIYQQEGTNPDDFLAHAVKLESNSRLAKILQTDTLWVNSLHHQAVESVSNSLQIMGRSTDGVVEVVEQVGHPFFCGVQWHPELLVAEHRQARQIFEAFVKACAA